jgi:glutamate-5-semialdehyde dehydrogenase
VGWCPWCKARVPTLLHLDGNNHTYVLALIWKKRRHWSTPDAPDWWYLQRDARVCRDRQQIWSVPTASGDGTLGTANCAAMHRRAIVPDMIATVRIGTQEYLSNIMSVRLSGVEDGIAFVRGIHPGHTDAIIIENAAAIKLFMTAIISLLLKRR